MAVTAKTNLKMAVNAKNNKYKKSYCIAHGTDEMELTKTWYSFVDVWCEGVC